MSRLQGSEPVAGPLRALRRGAMLFLAFAVLVPSAGQAYTIGSDFSFPRHTREEQLDPYYLVGWLTWGEKGGGISWDAEAPSDGPAGPVKNVVNDNQQYVGSVNNEFLGAPPAPVEFVSEPLPFDLYLNASRLLQFDIYVAQPPDAERANSPPCTGNEWSQNAGAAAPELKLWSGEKLVAGAAGSSSLNFGFTIEYYQPDPPGYDICYYRLPAEVEKIPKGTQLKLQLITHAESFRIYQYGTSDEDRSMLRIPYYSEDEILYRYPELNDWATLDDALVPAEDAGDDEDAKPTPGPGAGFVGAGGLLVAGVGGFSMARPALRRRLWLLAIVGSLVLVGLSGCMGRSADPASPIATESEPTGGATSVFQPANGSALAGGGLGAIVGLVHDDLYMPLRGVYASILGASNATQSDPHGRFKFRGMSPGTYTLRLDRDAYQSIETEVRVVKDTLTRVEATLLPLEAKEGDARAHKHDYWASEKSALLFDETLGKVCNQSNANCLPAGTFALPADTEKPRLVRPGTREVEVTVTWNMDAMGIDQVGLLVQSNSDSNHTSYLPRASPATFRVMTNWEMTDVGHQQVSTWRFQIYSSERDRPNAPDPQLVTDEVASRVQEPPRFGVKVVIHRGSVPLERPHPDHWAGATALPTDKRVTAGPSSQEVILLDLLFGLGFVTYCAEQTWLNHQWTPQSIIPPGTTAIEIVAKQARATGIQGIGHYGFAIQYRPDGKDADPFVFPKADVPASNPAYQAAPAPQMSGDKTTLTWRIPVKATEADATYAQRSVWALAAYPADMKQACLDTQTFAWTNPTAPSVLSVSWSMTALRETA